MIVCIKCNRTSQFTWEPSKTLCSTCALGAHVAAGGYDD